MARHKTMTEIILETVTVETLRQFLTNDLNIYIDPSRVTSRDAKSGELCEQCEQCCLNMFMLFVVQLCQFLAVGVHC